MVVRKFQSLVKSGMQPQTILQSAFRFGLAFPVAMHSAMFYAVSPIFTSS
jgi:hypothetical protein